MMYAACFFCAMVRAAESGVDEAVSPNVESEAGTGEGAAAESADTTADSNDPFRIKRQHGSSPLSGILSSVFNKKLGLIGSLSSISSSSSGSSKGVESHHHTYEYAVSVPLLLLHLLLLFPLLLIVSSSKYFPKQPPRCE